MSSGRSDRIYWANVLSNITKFSGEMSLLSWTSCYVRGTLNGGVEKTMEQLFIIMEEVLGECP